MTAFVYMEEEWLRPPTKSAEDYEAEARIHAERKEKIMELVTIAGGCVGVAAIPNPALAMNPYILAAASALFLAWAVENAAEQNARRMAAEKREAEAGRLREFEKDLTEKVEMMRDRHRNGDWSDVFDYDPTRSIGRDIG